jgi:hypothetical protein
MMRASRRSAKSAAAADDCAREEYSPSGVSVDALDPMLVTVEGRDGFVADLDT